MLNSLKGFSTRNLSLSRLIGAPTAARLTRQVLVVLCTLLLAYFLGRAPSLTYIFVPIMLVAAWVIYTHPELGIVGLLASALIIPFEIGTNTQTTLNVAFLAVPALGFFWLIEMVRNRSIHLAPSRTTLPLMGFIVTATVSLLVGYLPWVVFAQLAPFRAQLGAWAIMVFSVLAFWLAANRLRSLIWLQRLVWVFLGLGAVYILSRLVGGPFGAVGNYFITSSTGSLFWVWIVVLAAGQAMFNRDLAWQWRFALFGLVAMAFIVALSGDARSWASGWAPPLVGLGVLVAFRWPRLIVFMGLLAVLVALLNVPEVQKLILDYKSYDLLTRSAALSIVLEIVKANPLLGVGPANYYYYTPLYPILGYYVRFNSHNNYIDILAQTGLLGMLFFTWFVLATARLGWSLRRKFADGFAQGYVYSCLGGLVACLVASLLGDWFLPFVYNIGISGFRASVLGWLFLGGLVALEQMARRATSNPQAAGSA